MLRKITSLFSDIHDSQDFSLSADRLQTAVAALLVHASLIDGHIAEQEEQSLKKHLTAYFQLSSQDMEDLLQHAKQQEERSTDLYRFTKVLTEQLDQQGRQDIVEMLWEIVLADDVLDDFENNLVWRISELLGVSTRDRILLKKKVEAKKASQY